MDWIHGALLLLFAFVVNIPLGIWRARQRRFSWRWLLAVHLSIPLIYSLRVYWHLPLEMVPLTIGIAFAAQQAGAGLQREQIPKRGTRLN